MTLQVLAQSLPLVAKSDHWAVMVRRASKFAAPEWDPFRAWRLMASGDPDVLPHVGPVVYLSYDYHRAFWAGQSGDLNERFVQGHLKDSYRRSRWVFVSAIALRGNTPQYIVDQLECEVAKRMKPIDGKRWPVHTRLR